MTVTAVITGVGPVAPGGVGATEFWQATAAGRNLLARITRFDPEGNPVTVAGEVGFDADELIEHRYLVQTDRATQFGLAAADLAMADAMFSPPALNPFAAGVITTSCVGGAESGQRGLGNLWRCGPHHVSPYQSIAPFHAATTGQVSVRDSMKGPCGVLVTDEAGGLDALAHARRAIRRGARIMIAGAAEAPLCPYALAPQYSARMLSESADPATAYLPFSHGASGYAPAEGAAMFVVESAADAAERGSRPRAVIAGHGATFSAVAAFDPSGEGLAMACRKALAAAGCQPEDIDVVFADATAIPTADRAEVTVIKSLFGTKVPVTAPKAGFGRAYASASALDAAAAVLSLDHGIIPPIPALAEPIDELDFVVGAPRQAELRTALVLARGYGGMNSALVLRRPDR
ncbi:beta-ketoacyl synthase N-terminal-like domain-containing protein [Kutzneria sp. CA-103260]|uniref:beta-ketoacyl synthase N-terminal-like domain-containing protein n=1 Tax=Kutzneria sp. CA-103260 TaxID=2802641 RepID=UPI001BABDA21|nr:beta-ketoacyl synthase N-terminal-like domain-containing protein [Kutzneria sp. CA-103260]QUQ68727.1 ketosynthase chain-length factor [Kutzneria sp. CA-103260]